MNKKSIFFPAALVLLLLCGCSRDEKETEYEVYYKNTAGTSIYAESYSPAAETFDDLMTELLTQFAENPESSAYVSALPESVQILGYKRGIDALRIDFSEDYYDLDNIDEVLLRAALVKTIAQIPGVSQIMITVDSEQLLDAEGKPVPAMDEDSFIDTREGGINSYQYAELTLYFPDSDGTKLLEETRNVHYSSNMVLERVIAEQLVSGPEDSGRSPVLSSSAEVLDVSVRDEVCTVDFNEDFVQKPAEANSSAELALYAVVNSICGTADNVSGVRFTVDEEEDALFWGEISLDQTFYMNPDLIETEPGESAQTESKARTDDNSSEETEH